MDINKRYTLYLEWLRLHKEPLAKQLRESYVDFTKHDKQYLFRGLDFGGFIGFPLFLVLLCNLYVWHSLQCCVLAIAAGLYLYWFTRRAVDLCCRHYFGKYEYPKIIEDYVQSCLDQRLASITSGENREEIVESYRYYYRELISHPFNWQLLKSAHRR